MLEASPPLRRLEFGVEAAEGGNPEGGWEAPDGGLEVGLAALGVDDVVFVVELSGSVAAAPSGCPR